MAAKKKAPKRTAKKAAKKTAKKTAKKRIPKSKMKKCYIKKTGKTTWTAYNMQGKKIKSSSKSRDALKRVCMDMGYNPIPFKKNPK